MSRTKQDRARVASATPHEVQTAQAAMRSEGIKVSAKEIREAIAAHGRGRVKLYAILRIMNAAKGLLYLSESEAAFEVVSFKSFAGSDTLLDLVGKPIDTKVEMREIERFFENQEMAVLKDVLQKQLKGITVYCIGEIQIDAFVIGRLPGGGHAGVKTKIIET